MPRESLLALPLDGAALTAAPAAHASFPVANLFTDPPDDAWQSTSTASQAITLDLGNATTTVRLIALLFTNFSPSATWRIEASDVSNFASLRHDSGTIAFPASGAGVAPPDDWTDGIYEPPAFTVTQPRYWRLTLADPAPVAGFFSAGRLVVANPLSGGPSAEGADDTPDDLATIIGLANGSERAGTPVLVKMAENIEIWLRGDEKAAFTDALVRRGRSRPVLFIRDPEAAATRQRGMVYGRFLQRPAVSLAAFDFFRFRFSVRGWRP